MAGGMGGGGRVGLWMPAVLVEAGEPKGRRSRPGDRKGREARPCATLMEDGGGREARQRSKLEVHTERRGPRVEWKMEEGRREGGGRGRGRKDGGVKGSQ